MKNEILSSLNRRFSGIGENPHLVVASLLDPRFKNTFFDSPEQQVKAKEMLLEEVRKVTGETVIEVEDSESANESETNSLNEPVSKRVNREAETTELWKSFEEILKESGSLVESRLASVTSSVEQYLTEPLIEFHRSNCYNWWRDNKTRFP